MQTWHYMSPEYPKDAQVENVFCTFTDCSMRVTSSQGVTTIDADCLNTYCDCSNISSVCRDDEFIRDTVRGLTGQGVITCNNVTSICQVQRMNYILRNSYDSVDQGLPIFITMKCLGSQCTPKFMPIEETPTSK